MALHENPKGKPENNLPGVPARAKPTTSYDKFFSMLTHNFDLDPHTKDPDARAAVAGLRIVAEGLASNDLSRRAHATRATNIMIALDNGEAKPDFERSPFSAEEIDLGLRKVVTSVPGRIADEVRARFSVLESPHEAEETTRSNPFTPEETPLALMLIARGLSICEEVADEGGAGRIVTPNEIWSEEYSLDVQKDLMDDGLTPPLDEDYSQSLVSNVHAKLYAQLDSAITANSHADYRLHSVVESLPTQTDR